MKEEEEEGEYIGVGDGSGRRGWNGYCQELVLVGEE